MKVNLPSKQQIIQEALHILLAHMEPLKVARFVTACHLDQGDYLETKDQLFASETVDSLFEKIQAYQQSKDQ